MQIASEKCSQPGSAFLRMHPRTIPRTNARLPYVRITYVWHEREVPFKRTVERKSSVCPIDFTLREDEFV